MKTMLSGKVAIVTGASSNGLGRADAMALGRQGAKVAVVDIRPCDETLHLLKNAGVKAFAYTCDISDSKQTDALVESVLKDLGKIDILINNASILTTVGHFTDIPVDLWNRDVQVNLIGSANMTRSVWPHLSKNKWGRVIFMSSIAGTRGGAGQTSYSATKAALVGLSKSLAIEGARYGITVNAIAPGVVETEAVQFMRDDMKERMKKATAIRRFGKPEEIANTIAWLCSEESSYLTGQVVTVDGGAGLFLF